MSAPLDRDAVSRAIRESKNLGEAAKRLGCSRRTLQNRMREYGLAQGRSGRPKRKLSYGGRGRLYATGGAIAAGVIGLGLVLRRRGSSS